MGDRILLFWRAIYEAFSAARDGIGLENGGGSLCPPWEVVLEWGCQDGETVSTFRNCDNEHAKYRDIEAKY